MLGNKSAAALNPKIVNDEIIFVPSKATKAQHTKRYVSISATADWCKKNSSERFYLSRMMV